MILKKILIGFVCFILSFLTFPIVYFLLVIFVSIYNMKLTMLNTESFIYILYYLISMCLFMLSNASAIAKLIETEF